MPGSGFDFDCWNEIPMQSSFSEDQGFPLPTVPPKPQEAQKSEAAPVEPARDARFASSTCENCHSRKKKCVFEEGNVVCTRCKKAGLKCDLHLRKNLPSCVNCSKSKRACDNNDTCARCASLSLECVREATRTKRKSSTALTTSTSKRGTTSRKTVLLLPSSNELVLTDGLCEASFTHSLIETYMKHFGAIFNFSGDVLMRMDQGLSSLYSTTALRVRTDAILTKATMAMGMVQLSHQYGRRARQHAEDLFTDTSKDSFSALAALSFSTFGIDMAYSRALLSSFCKCCPGFDESATKSIFQLQQVLFMMALNQPGAMMSQSSMVVIHDRPPVRALHVREALIRYGRDKIFGFGCWDYAEFKFGDFDIIPVPMDRESAARKLADMDFAESRLKALFPNVLGDSPDYEDAFRVSVERFCTISNSSKTVLYFLMGEYEAARTMALIAIENFKSLYAQMWISNSVIDIVHVIDVIIALADGNLFNKAMILLRSLAPLLPIIDVLYQALQDIPLRYPLDLDSHGGTLDISSRNL